jgi:hypothetical protein
MITTNLFSQWLIDSGALNQSLRRYPAPMDVGNPFNVLARSAPASPTSFSIVFVFLTAADKFLQAVKVLGNLPPENQVTHQRSQFPAVL